MSPHSPENAYIHHIDQPPPQQSENREDYETGFSAEDVVIEFFESQFEGVKIRHATQEEDNGKKEIGSGKQIDAVLYHQDEPSAGLQITTSLDSKVRMKKMTELKDRPFIRLDEMSNQDVPIPKALIFVEPREVEGYLMDHDWSAHPKLSTQIFEGLENSLKFDLTQTKNPKEKAKVLDLLTIIATQKARIKKEDRPH